MRSMWKYLKTFDWYEVKPGVHKVIRGNNDYLVLLGEGRLVNLALATGTPKQVMDGSLQPSLSTNHAV